MPKLSQDDVIRMRKLRPTRSITALAKRFRVPIESVSLYCQGIAGPIEKHDAPPSPLWELHGSEPYIHNAGYTSEWDRMSRSERKCVR